MAKKKADKAEPIVKAVEMPALRTWQALNAAIKDWTEEQLQDALAAEKSGRNRPAFLLRLHGRFNMMRAERERRELCGGA